MDGLGEPVPAVELQNPAPVEPQPVAKSAVAPAPAAKPVPTTGREALNGKKIANVKASALASVTVLEFVATDGSSTLIKARHGEVEIGGTLEWGTGTQIL